MDLPNEKRLSELETKWLDGTITSQEMDEYASWYNYKQDEKIEIPSHLYASEQEHRESLLARINQMRKPRRMLHHRFTRLAAAIMIGVVFSVGWIYLSLDKQEIPVTVQQQELTKGIEVMPGSKKATLTLADGRKITLEEAAKGLLAEQGSAVVRNEDGSLVYSGAEGSGKLMFNTLTTSKGEQYPVTLADGTRVWLNAASSLRFPVSFPGDERRVEITGEAYFEVAKNPAKPFFVTVNSMTIAVLGTHFNVNAYSDESSIKATLLEGSVKINNQLVLKPGQQSQFSNNGDFRIIDNVDLEQAVAWKNGLFQFKDCDIETVMREIEKWYDITVVYEGARSEDKFGGKISRESSLSQVLEILEKSNVHFKLEGRKLTVLP